MKHEQIDDRAGVWIVTRGSDGELKEEFDPSLLARLNPGHSAQQIADALLMAAGELDLAKNRIW